MRANRAADLSKGEIMVQTVICLFDIVEEQVEVSFCRCTKRQIIGAYTVWFTWTSNALTGRYVAPNALKYSFVVLLLCKLKKK